MGKSKTLKVDEATHSALKVEAARRRVTLEALAARILARALRLGRE